MSKNEEKALKLKELINSFVSAENKIYKLLGIKSLREVYSLGRFSKVEGKPTPILKSLEELSKGQVGLFQNLNSLNDPEILEHFVNEFKVIPVGENPKGIMGAHTLLMADERYDSLGRRVITRYQIFFRDYTEEENEEFLRRTSQGDASSLGYGTGPKAKIELF